MSDSNSETSTSTSYSDSRMVLGEGAINAADNASVFQSITTNNTTTDQGSVKAAFSFGNNALDFAGGVVDRAFDFGDKTVSSSLNFANDALNASLNASAKSGAAAFNATQDALAFAGSAQASSVKTQREALDTAAGSMAGALAYSGKQTAVALDSLNSSAGLVKDAYADAKGRGAMTDYLLMAAIAVAGFVAFSALRK